MRVKHFYGVGKVTAGKMHTMGIKTGSDLMQMSLAELESAFGKADRFYYHTMRNQDHRPVEPNQERHSVGTADAFARDLRDPRELLIRLESIAHEVVRRMERSHFTGK